MARQTVTMLMLHGGTPRDLEAREQLAMALPEDAEMGAPDDIGVFDISVESADREHALHAVWNAVATSGTDDHILFLEHPDLPRALAHAQRRGFPPKPATRGRGRRPLPDRRASGASSEAPSMTASGKYGTAITYMPAARADATPGGESSSAAERSRRRAERRAGGQVDVRRGLGRRHVVGAYDDVEVAVGKRRDRQRPLDELARRVRGEADRNPGRAHGGHQLERARPRRHPGIQLGHHQLVQLVDQRLAAAGQPQHRARA